MRDLGKRGPVDRATAHGAGRIEVLQLDVNSSGSREAAIETVKERHGRLDVLVNNAGVAALGPVELEDVETTRLLFETNVFGPLALCQLVIPLMRDQGGGRIVN